MTLEEAINKKRELPTTYAHKGVIMNVIIAPAIRDDFLLMYRDSEVLAIYNRSEELAPRFSTDNDFLVIGMYWDGTNIITDANLQGLENDGYV